MIGSGSRWAYSPRNAYLLIAAAGVVHHFRGPLRARGRSRQRKARAKPPRRDGEASEYSGGAWSEAGQNRFLILHNDGAVNFTLVEAPVDPARQRTHRPHRDDVHSDAVGCLWPAIW